MMEIIVFILNYICFTQLQDLLCDIVRANKRALKHCNLLQ